ncbi:MAG TPA: LysR substrate-binding domain-containing protein [Ramlibacter sp.]|nr:LysR substrate-binding domain-containing protein [Ramlibacter sp.]
MELRQLRYFVGVSEAGSVLKAAGTLHVAQPALSQQIAALEQELGAKLFERSSRGMTLTEAGRLFLDHARLVLADVERARDSVRSASEVPSGEVAIGLPTSIALGTTVPILAACRDRLPQVRPRVVEGYSGHLREWLKMGRLDLALLYGDTADDVGLARRPLLDDRLVLLSAGQGPRAPKKLSLAALARWPLVLPGREHGLRKIIDEACTPAGIALQVVAEIEALGSVKKAVEAGLGATILPLVSALDEVAAGRLQASTIESASFSRRVVSATSVTRPTSVAGAAVMALVVDVIRGMVEAGDWPARWVGGTQRR